MLLDLDAAKVERMLVPLIKRPHGAASVHSKLTAFAETEGLAL
jgi:hypothetical protein